MNLKLSRMLFKIPNRNAWYHLILFIIYNSFMVGICIAKNFACLSTASTQFSYILSIREMMMNRRYKYHLHEFWHSMYTLQILGQCKNKDELISGWKPRKHVAASRTISIVPSPLKTNPKYRHKLQRQFDTVIPPKNLHYRF